MKSEPAFYEVTMKQLKVSNPGLFEKISQNPEQFYQLTEAGHYDNPELQRPIASQDREIILQASLGLS
jgi:hypothetical protein